MAADRGRTGAEVAQEHAPPTRSASAGPAARRKRRQQSRRRIMSARAAASEANTSSFHAGEEVLYMNPLAASPASKHVRARIRRLNQDGIHCTLDLPTGFAKAGVRMEELRPTHRTLNVREAKLKKAVRQRSRAKQNGWVGGSSSSASKTGPRKLHEESVRLKVGTYLACSTGTGDREKARARYNRLKNERSGLVGPVMPVWNPSEGSTGMATATEPKRLFTAPRQSRYSRGAKVWKAQRSTREIYAPRRGPATTRGLCPTQGQNSPTEQRRQFAPAMMLFDT